MNITARTEYACLAMLELAASHDRAEPTTIKQIAEVHSIPARFLVQILQQLKQAGLVRSTRGSAGGYQLVRSPETISLADILEAVESWPRDHVLAAQPLNATQRVLAETWSELTRQQFEQLQAIHLADLDRQARDQTAGMYYI